MIRAAILTVSDSCAQGERKDVGGQTIKDMLAEIEFEIYEKRIVADNHETIANELKYFSDEADVDVVPTTGETRLGPRDVTPEATRSVYYGGSNPPLPICPVNSISSDEFESL